MKFYDALRAELERVDVHNWEDKLDAIHGENGTWTATAGALGVHKRTLERWRKGYQPRSGGPRRRVDPSSFTDKIRDALGRDRKAQVAAVDWKRLFIHGTIVIEGYEDKPRRERMHVGKTLSDDSIAGIVKAYVAKNRGRTQDAIDDALSLDYIRQPTRLIDVESLNFG